jgi:hypothetical protein
MKSVQATQEVLGIYLSCLEGTLAYNLPTLIPVGEVKEEGWMEEMYELMENIKLPEMRRLALKQLGCVAEV